MLQQGLRAVVTRADVHAVAGENLADVVRVDAVDGEGQDAAVLLGLLRAENVDVRHAAQLLERAGRERDLAAVDRVEADAADIVDRGVQPGGVVLCILSAIPVLLGTLAADSVAAPERIMLPCVSLLLAMVAVAVYLFVRVGMVQGSFQRLLEEGDYTREGKRAARSPIVPIYWCLVTAAYLAWSFITMAWDRTWIVWPVAGVLFAAVVGIIRMTHKEGRKEKKAG